MFLKRNAVSMSPQGKQVRIDVTNEKLKKIESENLFKPPWPKTVTKF